MAEIRSTLATGRRGESPRSVPWSENAPELIAFLNDLSREALRDAEMNRMIPRFIELVHSRIGPAKFTLFDVVAQSGKPYQISPSPIKFRKDRSIQRELSDQLNLLIVTAINQSDASSDGIQSISIIDQEFFYLLIGEPQFQRWVLVIHMESGPTEDAERNKALLDFVARQIQFSTAWACRLESAQSQLYRDDLTGLYNTRYMEEVLEKEVRRAIRFGSRFCVFFVDLDNLKEVNDRHGHLTGSSVLKQFAELLRLELREVDSLIRYGGDEYIVLLLGADAKVGSIVAERLRNRIDQHAFLTDAGNPLHITCSIGVAAFPEHGRSRDELLKVADDCMYRGKRTGKNQVIIADPTSLVGPNTGGRS